LPTDYAHAEGFADWFTEEDKKAYIDMFEHITHCSNCKGVFDDRTIKDWRHCPYCGATMDGVNNSRND
jgi:rRNA maturation endonuclease Nob1